MENYPKFLTAREVAQNFFGGKMTYKKVLELSKDGVLPCKKFGGAYYYTYDALKRWSDEVMNTPVWKKIRKGGTY